MNPIFGITAALVSSLLWALSSVLFQQILKTHGPYVTNVFKTVLGMSLFWITAWVAVPHLSPNTLPTSATLMLLLSGMVGMAVGDFAYFAAIRHMGVGQATLLHGTAPLFLLGFGLVEGKEVLATTEILGVLLVVAGVLEVSRRRIKPRNPDRKMRWSPGITWGIVAAICQSAGIILARDALRECHFVQGAAIRLSGATLGLFMAAALRGRVTVFLKTLSNRDLWRTATGPTLMGTYLGVAGMMMAITWSKTAVAGALLGMTPVFVIPIAWLLLKDRTSWQVLLGTAVAVAGVVLISI